MYQFSKIVSCTALLLTFISVEAKTPEFVPEKRKPTAKRAPAKSAYKAIAYPDFPEVMSYHDLMSLPPYKRIAYIKGIRAMLVELSQRARLGHGTLVADSGIVELIHPEVLQEEEHYNALLRIFEMLVPSVYADSGCPAGYNISVSGRCAKACEQKSSGETFFRLPGGGGVCALNSSNRGTWPTPSQWQQAATETQLRIDNSKLERGKQRAEQQTREANETVGSLRQQNSTTQNRLDAAIAENTQQSERLRTVTGQRDAAIDDRNKANVDRDTAVADRDQAYASRDAAVDKATEVTRERDQLTGQLETQSARLQDTEKQTAELSHELDLKSRSPMPIAPAKSFDDTLTEMRGADEAQRQLANNHKTDSPGNPESPGGSQTAATTPPTATAPAATNPPGATPQNVQQIAGAHAAAPGGGVNAMTAQSAIENLPPSTPEVCKKTLLKCEARLAGQLDKKSTKSYLEERSKSLQEFRDKSKTACVSSGNMSAYNNGEAKAGNCKPVNTFCFNPEDERCTEKGKYQAGSSRKEREGAEAGKADSKDGKFFTCKSKTDVLCNPLVFGHMKDNSGICVKTGGADLTVNCNRAVEALEKKNKGKGDKGDYVADIMKDGAAGVANAWDDWRDAFNQTCRGESISQSAHCEECTIIGKRLNDLHRIATGSCDSAKKFKDLPPPSSTQSTTTN